MNVQAIWLGCQILDNSKSIYLYLFFLFKLYFPPQSDIDLSEGFASPNP